MAPFWLWNIRFNKQQAVFITTIGSYVTGMVSSKNECQINSYFRSWKCKYLKMWDNKLNFNDQKRGYVWNEWMAENQNKSDEIRTPGEILFPALRYKYNGLLFVSLCLIYSDWNQCEEFSDISAIYRCIYQSSRLNVIILSYGVRYVFNLLCHIGGMAFELTFCVWMWRFCFIFQLKFYNYCTSMHYLNTISMCIIM